MLPQKTFVPRFSSRFERLKLHPPIGKARKALARTYLEIILDERASANICIEDDFSAFRVQSE